MPLRTVFQLATLMENEVERFLVKKRIDIRAECKRQSNGLIGFHFGWARFPAYLDDAPKFPAEWQARHFFYEEVFEVELKQGRYEIGEGDQAVTMNVQKKWSTKAKQMCYEVDAQSSDLKALSDVFQKLCLGQLTPTEAWSTSPGAVEAPKEEGSAPHVLPPTATTPTTQAA